MEAFKYSLDKSSKKHICPNCNKKTFVLYIDTETGEYLPTDYGRCDREQNCNYHKAPPKGKKAFLIDFLALESISNKAYKLTDLNGVISIVPKSQILEIINKSCFVSEWYLQTSIINYLNSESKYFNNDKFEFKNEVLNNISLSVHVRKEKPSFHDLELLNEMYFKNPISDNLTEFLKSKFSNDEVFKAMQNYFITGTNLSWNNTTVFWQIDNKENVRGAKLMLYDKITGKRKKEPYNHINWLHKALNLNDFKLNQCLFGLHLINEDNQKTIAIVESEKTAIVMSLFLPDFFWLATGSEGNFKFETLEPIKKRNVIAFPDKGIFDNWNKKANELKNIGFKITISDLVEKTNFENGFDLADYYFL